MQNILLNEAHISRGKDAWMATENDDELNAMFRGAYGGASPIIKDDVIGKLGTAHALGRTQELCAHFRAAAQKKGRPPAWLPDVPALEDQIALDRKQFPTLDDEARAQTVRNLEAAKRIARNFIQAARDDEGNNEGDKLVLLEHARLHLTSAAVYYDRLENAKPKPAAKGATP